MNTTANEKIDPMPIPLLGMWLFLASEAMFFIGLLGAFIVLKSAGGQHELFEQSSHLLSNVIGLLSAVMLLCSSAVFIRPTRIAQWIGIVTAACFLALQLVQWRVLLLHGNGPWQNNFFGCYFLLSALHCVHLVAGIIAVVWFVVFAAGKLPDPVQIYWHFVNAVGVITLVGLYFI